MTKLLSRRVVCSEKSRQFVALVGIRQKTHDDTTKPSPLPSVVWGDDKAIWGYSGPLVAEI